MSLRIGLGASVVIMLLGVGELAVAAEAEATSENDGDAKAGDEAAAKAAKDDKAQGAPSGATATAATPDVPEEEQALPPRVPWRGTNLAWSNNATTTMLGVGQDLGGRDEEVYSMDWALTLNYVVVDQDKFSFSVSTVPSMTVELTDGSTTKKREVLFNDLPISGSYKHKLYSKDEWSTGMSLGGGISLPTSRHSFNGGTVLGTSNSIGLSQGIPLLAAAMDDAPVLKSFSLSGSVRWDHKFTKADIRTSGDTVRLRMNSAGTAIPSDALSFGGIKHDVVRESIGVAFSEAPGGFPLGLNVGWVFTQSVPYKFGDNSACDVQLVTGCVDPAQDTSRPGAGEGPTFQHGWGFDVGIDFAPVPELGIGLAYANSHNQLKSDGTRGQLFYSPDAFFSGTLTFNIDALYERITGPPRALAEKKGTRRAF